MDAPTPETASERRRLQSRAEDARRAILDATEALLVEDGVEAFSMRALAERCGYTAPTIYHYFGDKDGLIDALLEERFRRCWRRCGACGAGRRPGSRPARMIGVAFVRFGLRNPTHCVSCSRPREPELRRAAAPSVEARGADGRTAREARRRRTARGARHRGGLQVPVGAMHG